jgi:hypothetical protein
MEGKVRPEEVQKPSSNECRCQEKVVGVNEGALGGEEKAEGIVQSLNTAGRGLRSPSIP